MEGKLAAQMHHRKAFIRPAAWQRSIGALATELQITAVQSNEALLFFTIQGDEAEASIHHAELGVAPGVGEVVLALHFGDRHVVGARSQEAVVRGVVQGDDRPRCQQGMWLANLVGGPRPCDLIIRVGRLSSHLRSSHLHPRFARGRVEGHLLACPNSFPDCVTLGASGAPGAVTGVVLVGGVSAIVSCQHRDATAPKASMVAPLGTEVQAELAILTLQRGHCCHCQVSSR